MRNAIINMLASVRSNFELPINYFSDALFTFHSINITPYYIGSYVRRDPSDIVFFGGKYHCFFNLALRPNTNDYTCRLGHMTSIDTINWVEQPVALGFGENGDFDERGSGIAPAVFIEKNVMYVIYEGWGDSDYISETSGPLKTHNSYVYSSDGITFTRSGIITLDTGGVGSPDEWRAADPTLVYHNGGIKWYNKTRSATETAGQTSTALATNSTITTPFTKYIDGEAVIVNGHEGAFYKIGQKVIGLISNPYGSSPKGEIYESDNGIDFIKRRELTLYTQFPFGAGCYRTPDQFNNTNGKGLIWGLDMKQNINSVTEINCLRKFTVNLGV